MVYEASDHDEYGSSIPPIASGEYERIIDSIDMQMAPDAAGEYVTQQEPTKPHIVADALGSLGLGELVQDDVLGEMIPSGNEDIAPETIASEVADPPEVHIAAKPVVEVIEPSSPRPVEAAEVTKVRVGGFDCVPSSISSGFAYKISDNVTPGMDRANNRVLMEGRQRIEAQGHPPMGDNAQLVATARQAILEYGRRLGFDIDDRLPSYKLYRFFDLTDDFTTAYGRNLGAGTAAVAKNGLGILVDGAEYNDMPESLRLYALTHETAHLSFKTILRPCVSQDGVTAWMSYLSVVRNRSGKLESRTGVIESVTDLMAKRSLLPSTSLTAPPVHRPSVFNPINALLHGAIEKTAVRYDERPSKVADAIVKGAITGDMSARNAIHTSLRGKNSSPFLLWSIGNSVSFSAAREIARKLGLQNTVELIDNRSQGSLRMLYDWR